MTKELNLQELEKWVHQFAQDLKARDLILLSGEMGAGKTQWVKFLCQALGCEQASSPSYSLHNHYESPSGLHIEHLDFYRLQSREDLESIGFWDLFSLTESIICIEWPAEDLSYPKNWRQFYIQLEVLDSLNRRIHCQQM